MRTPNKISERHRNVIDYCTVNNGGIQEIGQQQQYFQLCRKYMMLIYKNLSLQANAKCKRAINPQGNCEVPIKGNLQKRVAYWLVKSFFDLLKQKVNVSQAFSITRKSFYHRCFPENYAKFYIILFHRTPLCDYF